MNDAILSVTETPGAALLLAAMLIASLWGLFKAPAMVERNLFRPHWLLPRHEYATLVTSAFLHADLSHLIFNSFTFWAFGFGLERTVGTPTFLALYAFGLMVSNAGTWLAHRHEPDYASLGASGAILAVLVAAIVYHPASSIFILPIPVPIPAPLFALGYLAYTIYAERRGGGRVNHVAHLGGALAGVAFVAVTDWPTLVMAWRNVTA